MNILQIVQEFCRRQGLVIPQLVIGSQDDQLEQIVGLANEIGEDLVVRRNWSGLVREATFASVAGEDQGAMTDLAPFSFYKILNETIFDRTRNLPLYGPQNARNWQMSKSLQFTGPFHQYRIRGGRLLTLPALPEGHTIAFEYVSKAIAYNADANTYKVWFTSDADKCQVDCNLLLKGLRWRWKAEKGFPYAEDFRAYEIAAANMAAADGGAPTIHMDDSFIPGPVVVAPPGNWNLS